MDGFIYAARTLISDTELIVVLLIPLVGAVWKRQVRENQFSVLFIARKKEKSWR